MADTDDSNISDFIEDVSDNRTKELILEAYANLKIGSLKSAIMMTWTAISFDIFAKIYELAELGDKSVTEFLEEISNAYKSQNKHKLLDIENQLLPKAKDELELLTNDEFESLERVKSDRNKCVHPDFSGNYELFNPTKEIVITHIAHALKYLLIQQAKQGKFAINDLKNDLLNQQLLSDEDEFRNFIRERHLSRPKNSLVNQQIKLLFKLLFGGEREKYAEKARFFALTLSEISREKRQIFDNVVPQTLYNHIHTCPPENLLPICRLIRFAPEIMEFLIDSDVNRIIMAIGTSNLSDFVQFHVYDGVFISEFEVATMNRIKNIDCKTEKINILCTANHISLKKLVIEIFGQSDNILETDTLWEKLVLPYSHFFNSEDVRTTLNHIQNNQFILNANKTPHSLMELYFNTTRLLSMTNEYWINFIENYSSTKSGQSPQNLININSDEFGY